VLKNILINLKPHKCGAFFMNELQVRDQLAIERTKLANERTFLAYFRSSVVFLSSGIAIFKIQYLQEIKTIGIVLIVLGPILFLAGITHYLQKQRKIKKISGIN